jgi:hypothetical protein
LSVIDMERNSINNTPGAFGHSGEEKMFDIEDIEEKKRKDETKQDLITLINYLREKECLGGLLVLARDL